MKKMFLAILLLFSSSMFSQINWGKKLGGGYTNRALSLVKCQDDTYCILTNESFYPPSESFMGLIKMNVNGDTLWTKKYKSLSPSNNLYGIDLKSTNDSGFVVTGNCADNSIFVFRLNSLGDTLWTKKYNGYKSSDALSIDVFDDNGMIVHGRTDSSSAADPSKHYLLRLDPMGTVLWTKIFKRPHWDGRVAKTMDGGVIFVATYFSPFSDILIIKFNPTGTVEWSKLYTGPSSGADDSDYGLFITEEHDGSYAVSGRSSSYDSVGAFVQLFFKLDSVGNVILAKAYASSSYDNEVYSHERTSDGGYIFVGSTRMTESDNDHLFLMKTDSLGNVVWSKSYGSSNFNDAGYMIKETTDKGFIIAGDKQVPMSGVYSISVIKTDSTGVFDCESLPVSTNMANINLTSSVFNFSSSDSVRVSQFPSVLSSGINTSDLCFATSVINKPTTQDFMKIFPNPFSERISILYKTKSLESQVQVEILDILGQKIFSTILVDSDGVFTINMQCSPGVFLVRLMYKKEILCSQRIIKTN